MPGAVAIRLAFLVDAAGWGLVLAGPGNSLELSRSTRGMQAVMSEGAWTITFVLAAAALAWAFRRPGRWRVATTIGVGFGHLLMALSFAKESHLLSPAAMTELALVVLAYWLLTVDLVDMRAVRRALLA